jgi:serine/threonine-protein kinase
LNDPARLRGERGDYLLRHRLGTGGVSEVFLAIEGGCSAVHRSVAVKFLRPELEGVPMLVEMFRDEIRIARQLRHPNVCAVLDWGEAEGTRPFMVLEYLHGVTFEKLATSASSVPLALCVRIVCDAARGLHAAHEATASDGTPLCVVHRDVSPANLFVLHGGRTKVTDFGVAVGKTRTTRTPAGSWRGSPAYMSPEQLAWLPTDRRADVFALGIVLWEATLGRRLFCGETDDATIRNVWGMAVPPPSSIEPLYPCGLERAVLGALDRDLAKRTPTAAALADELEGFLASSGHPVGEPEVAEVMRRLFGS